MAQRVFRTIGTAADDVKAVFGDDASDLAAQFLVWALAETERCGLPCVDPMRCVDTSARATSVSAGLCLHVLIRLPRQAAQRCSA